jgi:hypothetical protein
MDKYSDGSMIQQKFQSWGHSRDVIPGELKPKFEMTKEEALARLLEGYPIEKVLEVNYNTLPAYIVDNQEKYADYIIPTDEL